MDMKNELRMNFGWCILVFIMKKLLIKVITSSLIHTTCNNEIIIKNMFFSIGELKVKKLSDLFINPIN